uniref:Uncharacterized protein n=1 Tax=Neolamprologus brichardi TaxID=32507 RepID=A0A3Q4IDE2_NEOBR
MDGAVCLLEGMCNVAHMFGAITFVDELDKVMKKMDIISGTLCNCCIGFIEDLISMPCCAILKSEEGQMLRRKHQTTVKLLRQMLMDSGFPVVHCPNHIILVQVRKFISVLHSKFNLRLRLMHYFFSVSLTIQLPILSPALAECNFCQQLLHFER